jgi:hypothetical protein
MAKFLNKKEQVYDLKLTSYGHYLLSVGSFKPKYYTFLDDNILYDKRYAEVYYHNTNPATNEESELTNTNVGPEQQNEIHKRIKQETQYLESIVHFDDVERAKGSVGPNDPTSDFTDTDMAGLTEDGNDRWFAIDLVPTKITPAVDRFRLNSVIGDARFEGSSNTMPAWKIAMLQGEIVSSSYNNPVTKEKVPQIDVSLNYTKKTQDFTTLIDPKSIQSLRSTIGSFVDNKQIVFDRQDAVIYAEEVNTELLNENFEIEVYLQTVPARLTNAELILEVVGEDVDEYDELQFALIDTLGNTLILLFRDNAPSSATGDILDKSKNADGQISSMVVVGLKTVAGLSGADAKKGIAQQIAKAIDTAQRHKLTFISYGLNNDRVRLRQTVAGDSGNTAIKTPRTGRLMSEYSDLFRFYIPSSRSGLAARSSIFQGGKDEPPVWERKYFEKKLEQVVDGYMLYETPPERYNTNYTSGAVEYYFDIHTDKEIEPMLACKGLEMFNRSSFYIDLDFDCDEEKDENVFYDIYGKVTEPEVCLD